MKKMGLLALMLLLLFGLVACGGSSPAAETTTETAVVTSPTEAASTPETAVEDTTTIETTAEEAAPEETAAVAIVAVENEKLNLNEASGDDFLNAIPNFSSRMVREFQEYRPYISIQQFRREIGKYVSDEQVAEYEQYVYVPVDVDESDAATLMQLPGVDEAIAEMLIGERPFGSNDAFLTALATHVSADDVSLAVGYLAAD
ncbi:MAG: hypothetical protein KC449_20470 [Anaerolineales bacterium]|nr:hypothetical protein [Anaerolineales bacterium]